MKNERGITLVALLITITVMVIIVAVSVDIGTESLDNTRLQGFYTQLEIVQKRVDDIATTNESYLDSNGSVVYIKEQGTAYADLTSDKKTALQNIITNEGEGVISDVTTFRYFTTDQIKNILDLDEIEYNLFIDFETRTIIAEEGITLDGQSYHILKNNVYFAGQNQNKNEGEITSLSYNVTTYGTDKYKVVITPSNTIGDLGGKGHVEYKKTTTKYWEISNNTEIIIELEVEYNVKYIDNNNNYIEKVIKVSLDTENENQPVVQEITK